MPKVQTCQKLGYAVGYRVLSAQEYGSAQRRLRLYIWGCRVQHEPLVQKFYPPWFSSIEAMVCQMTITHFPLDAFLLPASHQILAQWVQDLNPKP